MELCGAIRSSACLVSTLRLQHWRWETRPWRVNLEPFLSLSVTSNTIPAAELRHGWQQVVDVFLLSLTSVQISCVPHRTSLEATLERSLQGRLDSVVMGWTRHGQLEQVTAQHVAWPWSNDWLRSNKYCSPFLSLWNILANNASQQSDLFWISAVSPLVPKWFCSSRGRSSQLVESIWGDERDQAGAEAALLLHAQPAVPSHTVAQLTEGTAQQPAGRLPHCQTFMLHYHTNIFLSYSSPFVTLNVSLQVEQGRCFCFSLVFLSLWKFFSCLQRQSDNHNKTRQYKLRFAWQSYKRVSRHET